MASTPQQVHAFFEARGSISAFRWLDANGREVARKVFATQVSLQKRLQERGGILTIRLDVDQLADFHEQLGSIEELCT
jgi:hypothetical protein